MEAAVQGGANRFSLGVQTFDTKVRQAVGRRSTKEQLVSQLSRLTRFNQAAVVIDLIYGFPFQTMGTWKEDLAISRELNLDGVDFISFAFLNALRSLSTLQTENFRPVRITNSVPLCSLKQYKACEKQDGAAYPSATGLQIQENATSTTITPKLVRTV